MLKNNWIIVLLVGFCIQILSCTSPSLNENELNFYLKNEGNGLIYRKEEGPFRISAMYKPSELLAKKELRDESDADIIKEVTERYNKYLYIVLNYEYKGEELLNAFVSNRSKYAELINTLTFRMNEKVSIVTDSKKKIPLADSIHSRLYGMGGGSKVLLVFNREEVLTHTTNTFNIKLNDIGIGLECITFTLDKEQIENCPTLK